MKPILRTLFALACMAALPAMADDEPGTRSELAQQLVALAAQYEHGEGMPQDLARAGELYCEAARKDDALGFFALAFMFGDGRGFARDDRIAASLMARAAELGLEQAKNAQRFFGPPAGIFPACLAPPKARASNPTVITDEANIDAVLAALPANKRRVAELIRLIAPQYSIEPRLALAVAAAESNFESLARSPRNAYGVMQLIPETALRFKVRNIFDPAQNIKGGLAYLRWLMSYYRGDVLLALAAYNAGEGAVDHYRGIPPYRETVNYVKRIYGLFQKGSHSFDPGLVEASPILARR